MISARKSPIACQRQEFGPQTAAGHGIDLRPCHSQPCTVPTWAAHHRPHFGHGNGTMENPWDIGRWNYHEFQLETRFSNLWNMIKQLFHHFPLGFPWNLPPPIKSEPWAKIPVQQQIRATNASQKTPGFLPRKKLGCFTTKNGDLTMTHVDLATKKWRFHHEQLGLNYSKLGMKQERPTCHQEKGWSDLENVIFTCFNSEKGKFVGLNKRKELEVDHQGLGFKLQCQTWWMFIIPSHLSGYYYY